MDGTQTEPTETAIDVVSTVESETSTPLRPVTPDEAWAAIEGTRYYAPLDKKKFEAKSVFGKYLTSRLSTDIFMVNIFETLELLQESVRIALQIAQDEKVPSDDRIRAVLASASAGNSISDMTRQAEEMVEKSQPQKTVQRKNLPPPGAQNLILAQNVTFPTTNSDKNGK